VHQQVLLFLKKKTGVVTEDLNAGKAHFFDRRRHQGTSPKKYQTDLLEVHKSTETHVDILFQLLLSYL
jgi:hypothetical protein